MELTIIPKEVPCITEAEPERVPQIEDVLGGGRCTLKSARAANTFAASFFISVLFKQSPFTQAGQWAWIGDLFKDTCRGM